MAMILILMVGMLALEVTGGVGVEAAAGNRKAVLVGEINADYDIQKLKSNILNLLLFLQ